MNEVKTPLLIEDLGMQYPTVTSKKKRHYGLYVCGYCGNNFKTLTDNIDRGHTTSCGCNKKQRIKETKTTHGLRYHKIYKSWECIIQRCTNPKSTYFKNYGGRGISVCNRWLKFENFSEDMLDSYQEGLSIDRINTEGNYESSNCRWTTRTVQSRNTRRIYSSNTSGYRGVVFHKASNKWVSKIGLDGKQKCLGYFKTAIEAAIAYDEYVVSNKLEHTINGVI